MTQRKTAARAPGQAEFTLSYEPGVGVDFSIDWFVDWLETRIRNGERFRAGETLQVGWLTCLITANPDGTLAVQEPDFETIAPTLTEDVSRTLGQLWYQREIAASVGLAEELDFPSFDMQAMTCAAFTESDGAIMRRFAHPADESGWFIGCRGDDDDHNDSAQIEYRTLYELAVVNPAIVGYLALPADCIVIIGDGAPVIGRGDEALDFRAGSLLATTFG